MAQNTTTDDAQTETKIHDSGYRTGPDGDVVGPKMHRAIKAVAQHGAFSARLPLAERVGPHSSRQYGYEIVNRCIHGFLTLDADHEAANPKGRGAVVLTEKGRRYIEAAGHEITIEDN